MTLDEADVVIGRRVLSYTVIVDETAFDQLLGIFMTLSQSEQIQRIFRYDSGTRVKDYTGSLLTNLDRLNNFIVIQEQIFLRNAIPASLFGHNSSFCLTINTVVFGSSADGSQIVQDNNACLFATILRTPCTFVNNTMYNLNIIINSNTDPCQMSPASMEEFAEN